MIKTEYNVNICFSCIHYPYCEVIWGTKCKMQGGKKIPRINYEPRGMVKDLNKKLKKKASVSPKPNLKTETIRTKVPNW